MSVKSINRDFWLTVAFFVLVIVAVQLYRGAFQAEFTAKPDEAAHFVTSLMVRDYLGELTRWPPPDPMPWAINYYTHYPKVGLGHWPPGYYLVQSIWWLVFPPSRSSAILLNTAMAALTAGLFFAVAKRIRPGLPAVLTCLALLAAPVTQEAMCETMSDLPSLLCGVLVLSCLAWLLRDPGAKPILYLSLSLAASLIVKGTGAALVMGPVLALATGLWRRLHWRWLVVPTLAGVVAAGWFYYQHFLLHRNVIAWAGIGNTMAWHPDLTMALAGPGLLVLALCGIGTGLVSRKAEVVAAAAIALSIFGTSFYVRAMHELRHWIAFLPALLLLALAFYDWLARRTKWAPGAVLAAMCFFPFSLVKTQNVGFHELAQQIKIPARMLISAPEGWPEGSWIAEVALRERRPDSLILRGTKLFAAVGWNNKPYRLLTKTAADMEQAIDEAGVEVIILHTSQIADPLPHHGLLTELLKDNPRWRSCGQVQELSAFCRFGEPRYPRKRVQIDMLDRLGTVIEEQKLP